MKRFLASRAVFTVLVGFMLLLAVAPRAPAQGCAACYSDAAAAGAKGRAALRHGILILLLPTLGLFGGTFAVFYRRRNVSRADRGL